MKSNRKVEYDRPLRRITLPKFPSQSVTRIGIADAHGIESYEFAEKLEKSTIDMLWIRAMANRHRHALVFRVVMSSKDDEKVMEFLKVGEWQKALTFVKEKNKKLEISQGCEKSWALIPNPALDPWR